jgi:hypothetical protein
MNAGSNNNNSSARNDPQQKCFACDRKIVDGGWFCKIPSVEKPTVILCSPRCAIRYFDALPPPTNGHEIEHAACERSVHFLVVDEKP